MGMSAGGCSETNQGSRNSQNCLNLIEVRVSIRQKQPFAWGLVLNNIFKNDNFLSLVSRSGCPTDVDLSPTGILRAKQSSMSADFFGKAVNPEQTSFLAQLYSSKVCRHAQTKSMTAPSS